MGAGRARNRHLPVEVEDRRAGDLAVRPELDQPFPQAS